jgi:hypothetical protein
LHWFGIVLSIAWAVGAGVHTRNDDAERAENFAAFAYRTCSTTKAQHHDADISSCQKEREDNLRTWMKNSDANVAFAALVPIPFGWLAGFILLYVGRAQVVGFKAVVPWRSLGRLKKAFVVFCVLASGATVVCGLVVLMNRYVDTEVPVLLGESAMVVKTGDDLVSVRGTWTRSGATEGSAMANPLQTSSIECNRGEHRCAEARAYVSGNVLFADLLEYDLDSWTKSAIVLKNEGLCASEVFTIDLNTEAVSGAGHRINGDQPFCKMLGSGEENWSYRLSNGFPVYWELRKKARPLPLRVIQTLLGN